MRIMHEEGKDQDYKDVILPGSNDGSDYNPFREARDRFGIKPGYGRKLHEKLWGYCGALVYYGIIALIVWVAALLLQLLFPANWSFAQGVLGVFSFIGKWVFILCAAIVICLYLVKYLAGLKGRVNSWINK